MTVGALGEYRDSGGVGARVGEEDGRARWILDVEVSVSPLYVVVYVLEIYFICLRMFCVRMCSHKRPTTGVPECELGAEIMT